jgi:hypothetical protein
MPLTRSSARESRSVQIEFSDVIGVLTYAGSQPMSGSMYIETEPSAKARRPARPGGSWAAAPSETAASSAAKSLKKGRMSRPFPRTGKLPLFLPGSTE